MIFFYQICNFFIKDEEGDLDGELGIYLPKILINRLKIETKQKYLSALIVFSELYN